MKMRNKRFIELSTENVDDYVVQNFDKLFTSQKKVVDKMFEGMDDLCPYKNDNELKNMVMTKFLNPERMSNHVTVIPETNTDFYEHVKCIQDLDIENKLIILLDENKTILSSEIVEIGNETNVGDLDRPYCNVFSYVLSEPKAKYFITVHNHPKVIATFPSHGDMATAYNEARIGNLFNVKLLDACIISEFDFYSQYQYERNNNINDIQSILKAHAPTELYDVLEKDKFLYRFLMRSSNTDI